MPVQTIQRDIDQPVFLAIVGHGSPDGDLGHIFFPENAEALGAEIFFYFYLQRDAAGLRLYQKINFTAGIFRGIIIWYDLCI